MKKLLLSVTTGLAIAGFAASAFAMSDAKHPKQEHWSFDGIRGHVDRPSAQRGYQVYKEVCAACHGLNRVAYRQLADIGFSEAEIKALAAEAKVQDGPNESGDMFERPGRASDLMVPPYANENAARASNGGAYPPDLSLIIKARHDGANYVHSLLTGYSEPPEGVVLGPNMHYNAYFPGGQIAMPPPLSADRVTYQDGTAASVEQMSRDVVNFLQWAAEPEMEARKQMGIKVMLFLAIMTGLFWVAKRRVWRDIH